MEGNMMRETYKTKHKQAIISYLASLGDTHVTIADVIQHFHTAGIEIGATTVYRHLEKLTESGHIKKYFLDKSKSACYQYVGNENCKDHYHFKCKSCGCVLHVECDELDEIIQHISEEHHFSADMQNTMFIGTCSACANRIKATY
jgi:Fur family ferric uptake transcriptional regulator